MLPALLRIYWAAELLQSRLLLSRKDWITTCAADRMQQQRTQQQQQQQRQPQGDRNRVMERMLSQLAHSKKARVSAELHTCALREQVRHACL